MSTIPKTQFAGDQNSSQKLRPILTSLNGDNSWLISFPRPTEDRARTGKSYFHIVHDPWLVGPAAMSPSWIVNLTLGAPAKAQSGMDVERMARNVELAARKGDDPAESKDESGERCIDAILINFHYLDHLHPPTLRTFDPDIPVVASLQAAPEVRKMAHFTKVATFRDLPPGHSDWKSLHPGDVLPPYLTVFRCTGHHELNFLNAIICTSTSPNTDDEIHEAILYSPHAVRITETTVQTLLNQSTPHISTVALLMGLKESFAFGMKNTFGVEYGLQMYRQSGARYWVTTHNSKLKYGGIVSYFIKDVFRTLEWGLGKEKGGDGKGEDEERQEVKVCEVENGDSVVLR